MNDAEMRRQAVEQFQRSVAAFVTSPSVQALNRAFVGAFEEMGRQLQPLLAEQRRRFEQACHQASSTAKGGAPDRRNIGGTERESVNPGRTQV